ncbi:MAG TPA: SagB/ThcOx family dehydrogenase, partial [Blastocatellia bacterium]|nr:SagB/ThcOx family dehydrogenase [Blastocatellia bacterium]
MSQNRDTDRAVAYHDSTKHSYWSVRTTPHYLDWENKPSPFKVYPDIEPIRLPQDLLRSGAAAFQAITHDVTAQADRSIPGLDHLASILFFSAGVTKQKSYPGGEIYFRAAACAGALYPVETYVVTRELEGLRPGLYHFNPGDFSLRLLREGDQRPLVLRATAGNEQAATAPVMLVYTAITWRSAWKYRARSYRYHFWDNGMIVANAMAIASAHGLASHLIMGFKEDEIDNLLGIDGEKELSLSLLTIGSDQGSKVSEAEAGATAGLDLKSIPLSRQEVDYPIIREMHRASSFEDRDEVIQWRSVSTGSPFIESKGKLIPLASFPPDALSEISIEEDILRRASTRRFAAKAVSFEELSLLLDTSTRGIQADFLNPAGAQ